MPSCGVRRTDLPAAGDVAAGASGRLQPLHAPPHGAEADAHRPPHAVRPAPGRRRRRPPRGVHPAPHAPARPAVVGPGARVDVVGRGSGRAARPADGGARAGPPRPALRRRRRRGARGVSPDLDHPRHAVDPDAAAAAVGRARRDGARPNTTRKVQADSIGAGSARRTEQRRRGVGVVTHYVAFTCNTVQGGAY